MIEYKIRRTPFLPNSTLTTIYIVYNDDKAMFTEKELNG